MFDLRHQMKRGGPREDRADRLREDEWSRNRQPHRDDRCPACGRRWHACSCPIEGVELTAVDMAELHDFDDAAPVMSRLDRINEQRVKARIAEEKQG